MDILYLFKLDLFSNPCSQHSNKQIVSSADFFSNYPKLYFSLFGSYLKIRIKENQEVSVFFQTRNDTGTTDFMTP